LLAGIAGSLNPSVEALMAVFEDMETASIPPTKQSFSILLSVMAGVLTVAILAVGALNWRGEGRRLESQDWLLEI
jgi:hypothetical protein